MSLARCCGTTRKGLRCSITATSRLTDDGGRLIGAPLQRGGKYCRLHTRPFCTFPAEFDGPAVVLLLDLETTGVDVASDQIVELAAYHAVAERDLRGAAFSTIVNASAQDTAFHVHGIDAAEITQGPPFGIAWARFVTFVEELQRLPVPDQSDSECEETPVTLPLEVPTVILAAHNGVKFDFAMILFECARHGCSWASLENWLFVDTLSIVQSSVAKLGGCAKLQCLVRGNCAELQAHRALDDCIALRAVLQHLADMLGIPLLDVLRPFAMKLDVHASVAQISVM